MAYILEIHEKTMDPKTNPKPFQKHRKTRRIARCGLF